MKPQSIKATLRNVFFQTVLMKKLVAAACLLSFHTQLFAQADSLREYILTYQDPKTEIIAKGRKLLLSKLISADTARIAEVVNYLLAQEDENHEAFSPMEKRLLYYWTGQYEKALADLPEAKATYGHRFGTKLLPEPDNLYAKLQQILTNQFPEIVGRIAASNVSREDKDFHRLNLAHLLTGAPFRYHHYRPDSLLQQTTAFLQAHPGSHYETHIRRNLLREVVYSPWGFGIEFFSGYGFLTKDLKTHFKHAIPIGIAFDAGYKNWVLYLREYVGFGLLQDTLRFAAGDWNKRAQVRTWLPEASVGYAVVDSRRLKLAPFAGIASCSISPTQHDKDKKLVNEDVGLTFTTTYTAGVNLDFKMGNPDRYITGTQAGKSYWFLRLRYTYNAPQFSKKYSGYNGNLHAVIVGIGGFGRIVKRYW